MIQDKKKIPAEEEKVHNIVKGVRLVWQPGLKYLIAISVYNTKPVNFMSICVESVQ